MDEQKYVRKDLYEKDTDLLVQEISSLKERISEIKDFMNWTLASLGILFVIVQIGVGFVLWLITRTPGG